MGNGMVIDPAHLEKEIAALREKGVSITPENLKISGREMCIRDRPAPADAPRAAAPAPVSYAVGNADDFAVIDDNEDLPF